MKTRYLSKILLVISLLIMVCSTAGVYATFSYSILPPSTAEKIIPMIVVGFTWDGSDMLPDDVEGENHAWLIRNLVDGELQDGTKIGLNNPKSQLNDYINDRLKGGWGWERDYFGSMAVTGGTTMNQLFGTEAAGLCFLIHVESDLEYYIFTTSVDLGVRGEANWLGTGNKTAGKPNIPLGDYIYPVYRTKITRTSTSDEWDIIETKKGKAISDWYDENRSNANITQIPAFDPHSWMEDVMGDEFTLEDAIWTFKGDNPTSYSLTKTNPVYYKIRSTANQSLTVSTNNTNAVIKIYDANKNLLATSRVSNNKATITWSASQNTTYFISLTGDTSIVFNVT